MTDTPAMDEKGLRAALDVFEIETKVNSKSLKHGLAEAIAAYLAATARSFKHCDGCDGHECTDRCKYPDPGQGDGAETIAKLRGALIAAGRHAGAGLADEVSNEFLMLVPEEIRLVIAGLRSSLKASQEAEVVKALEWEDRDYAGQVKVLGLTYTMQNGRDGWFVSVAGEYLPGDFETREQAKAAAQADFEARIRPYLATPQPSPEADGDAA